jgi:hypothetical protein
MVAGMYKVYKEGGLAGLLLAGTENVLRSSGTLLVHAAERLPSPGTSLLPNKRGILRINGVFKDKHKGQRCFVIGNGPSLKTQDLSPLASEITLAMSAFWKHPVVEKWQPSYYCFADPAFFDGSEPMREFFQSLRARIHSSTFFVPLSAAKVIQEQGLLPSEQTYHIAFHGTLSDSRIKSIDLVNFVPGVLSTSQLDIMVAMYMGCSPIYLLGLDHDWLAHRGMDRHFYEGKTIEDHPQAHGDLSLYSYKVDAQAVVNLWSGYEALLRLSRQERIEILNGTNGGFLDVFKRVNYEEVVGR